MSYNIYDKANDTLKKVAGRVADPTTDMISDAFNSATTYSVGDFCIYNNILWKCLAECVGQTPSEGTYWTQTNVGTELASTEDNWVEIDDTITPSSVSGTYTTKTYSQIIGAKKIIVICSTDEYIFDYANNKINGDLTCTHHYYYSTSWGLSYGIIVNNETGAIKIRCTQKGSSESYPSVTKILYTM